MNSNLRSNQYDKSCNLCSLRFTSKNILDLHFKIVHETNHMTKKKKLLLIIVTPYDQKVFKSSICNSRFALKTDLQRHILFLHKESTGAQVLSDNINEINMFLARFKSFLDLLLKTDIWQEKIKKKKNQKKNIWEKKLRKKF